VDVIILDINLFDVDLIFLTAGTVQLISDDDFRPAGQNLKPILWAKYDMIGAQPDTV
jgi:hypothetical protein